MKKLNRIFSVVLALLSVYMVISGLNMFFLTSGVVQGGEFSMLITIANQISLLMLWLSVFALWRLTSTREEADK